MYSLQHRSAVPRTKNPPTKDPRPQLSGRLLMDLETPPLDTENRLESNPPQSGFVLFNNIIVLLSRVRFSVLWLPPPSPSRPVRKNTRPRSTQFSVLYRWYYCAFVVPPKVGFLVPGSTARRPPKPSPSDRHCSHRADHATSHSSKKLVLCSLLQLLHLYITITITNTTSIIIITITIPIYYYYDYHYHHHY